jgi:hypothetical protein
MEVTMTDRLEKKKRLSAFLIRKYEEYRQKEIGQNHVAPSEKQYAQFLGVDHNSFSQWKTGGRLPSEVSDIDMMAEVMGDEIYEILEMAPRASRDRRLRNIEKRWRRMNDQQKKELDEHSANMVDNHDTIQQTS